MIIQIVSRIRVIRLIAMPNALDDFRASKTKRNPPSLVPSCRGEKNRMFEKNDVAAITTTESKKLRLADKARDIK
jgi:hypothetical protein